MWRFLPVLFVRLAAVMCVCVHVCMCVRVGETVEEGKKRGARPVLLMQGDFWSACCGDSS